MSDASQHPSKPEKEAPPHERRSSPRLSLHHEAHFHEILEHLFAKPAPTREDKESGS